MFSKRKIGPSLTTRPQGFAALGRPAMRADQHAQTRRVEKLELRQIDDQVVAAPFGCVGQGRPNRRRRREIEASSQPEDERLSAIFGLEVYA